MSYLIYLDDADRAYLDGLPLSTAARGRLEQFLLTDLGHLPDSFRNEPANRPQPGQPIFLVRHHFPDPEGDGRHHSLDIYLSDKDAAMGVWKIVFLEFDPPATTP